MTDRYQPTPKEALQSQDPLTTAIEFPMTALLDSSFRNKAYSSALKVFTDRWKEAGVQTGDVTKQATQNIERGVKAAEEGKTVDCIVHQLRSIGLAYALITTPGQRNGKYSLYGSFVGIIEKNTQESHDQREIIDLETIQNRLTRLKEEYGLLR